MDETPKQKACVFCKYWYGPHADKKIRDGLWFYAVRKGECLRHKRSVPSDRLCGDFEPHRYQYPDFV